MHWKGGGGGGGDSLVLDANYPPPTNRWPEAPLGAQSSFKLQQFSCSKGYAMNNQNRWPLWGGGGGDWHKASVSGCLPLAAPIGLSPLLSLTLCGSKHVSVVSTEPPDDLSCLTTPGVGRPGDRAVARAGDHVHLDSNSKSMLGLPTPALTCARWGVHLQDNFLDRGF